MAPQQPLFAELAPTDDELTALAAWLAPLGSRRAQWSALHDAGVVTTSVSQYQRATKGGDLVAALRALCHDRAAVVALLAQPVPQPRARVAVSTLAQQYYCDLQVHLGTQHEVRVSSRALTDGAAGHAVLESGAEPISDEEITRRMHAGETMGLVEVPMHATLEGIDVYGRADRVQLEGRRADVVLEFKFSSRRDLFASHVAQVHGYGALLAASGFDTTKLVHAVAVMPRGGRVATQASLADELAAAARRLASAAPFPKPAGARDSGIRSAKVNPLEGLAVRRLDTSSFVLHVFPHDPHAAERTLHWALAYWRGERAPEPTDAAGKCRACPFNAASLCEQARAPHDGRYAVQVLERPGKRTLHVLTPSR